MNRAVNGVSDDGLEGDKKKHRVYKVVLTGGLFSWHAQLKAQLQE